MRGCWGLTGPCVAQQCREITNRSVRSRADNVQALGFVRPAILLLVLHNFIYLLFIVLARSHVIHQASPHLRIKTQA